jgi:NADPH:quinone reductase-like Zn-dependent oxidoreductase
MPTLKRIQYHSYGGPELLALEEFEPAAPGRGEVLVKVAAAAANPMDWKIRKGELKFISGRKFPRGLGHDFAGVVQRVGDGVTRLTPGDEVLGATDMSTAGAFADAVLAKEKHLVKKPAGLSFEQAAALPTVGVTALQAIVDKGKLKAGQSAFIHGCLGGVGRVAAQIALNHGASVAGSCRPTASADAKALGIDPVVDFDFDPATLAGRFDLVFDTAGTLSIKAARTLLKPGGRIVDINGSAAKMLRSFTSRDFQTMFAKYKTEDFEELAQLAADGKLDFAVARTVPLADAIDALTELEDKHTPKGGKLVITQQ